MGDCHPATCYLLPNSNFQHPISNSRLKLPTPMDEHKQAIQAQFGATAAAYVASPSHANGDDLRQIATLAAALPRREMALDVATGGGHTARILAPHFVLVVASDLTGPMLRAAGEALAGWGAANVALLQSDAEALACADGSFDLVTCRIAPHHFPDPARFVREVARVLRPGGRFILEDSCAPEDAACAAWLDKIERTRDATHGRTLSARAWGDLVAAAGLTQRGQTIYPRRHLLDAWLDRAQTPAERRAAIHAAAAAASPAIRAALAIEIDEEGRVLGFTDEKVLLWADRVA